MDFRQDNKIDKMFLNKKPYDCYSPMPCDSSSEERPSEIWERFHGSGSDAGLETGLTHPELQSSSSPEVQSAENFSKPSEVILKSQFCTDFDKTF